MAEEPWPVVLSAAAERDLVGIPRWTITTFGRQQAESYAETSRAAIKALKAGPDISRVQVAR